MKKFKYDLRYFKKPSQLQLIYKIILFNTVYP